MLLSHKLLKEKQNLFEKKQFTSKCSSDFANNFEKIAEKNRQVWQDLRSKFRNISKTEKTDRKK